MYHYHGTIFEEHYTTSYGHHRHIFEHWTKINGRYRYDGMRDVFCYAAAGRDR